jgi:hypothetical protein
MPTVMGKYERISHDITKQLRIKDSQEKRWNNQMSTWDPGVQVVI